MNKRNGWPKSKFDYWLEAQVAERPLGQGLDKITWGGLGVIALCGLFWHPFWIAIPILLLVEVLYKLSWIMIYLYALVGLCMGKSKFYKPWQWTEDPNEEAEEEAAEYGRGE